MKELIDSSIVGTTLQLSLFTLEEEENALWEYE